MSPSPADIRAWTEIVQKKCSVRQPPAGDALINLSCDTHKRSILTCEKEVLRAALEAVPALFDAWVEVGAERRFYLKQAADLAALAGGEPKIFEALSSNEKTAFRSEFRKEVGIR